MDRWSVAVASFVVGVALSASPSLAEDAVESLPDIAATPEYTVTPPRDFPDVKLATLAGVNSSMSRQSVAINPKNPSVFLAAYGDLGFCSVRQSFNAGRTWTSPWRLPNWCFNPVVRWAPDGTRVYAAYVTSTAEWVGVGVTFSTDGGITWSPLKILNPYFGVGDPDFFTLRLATPLLSRDSKRVYVLSSWLDYDGSSAWLQINRSDDKGTTWSMPQLIKSYNPFNYDMTSSSVAGGRGGEILVAYNHRDHGSGFVEVVHSGDYGQHFGKPVAVVRDAVSEPAVALGIGGTGHMVYTISDSPQQLSGVYYVYSTKAPYTTWSTPKILQSSGPDASSIYPALAVSTCGSSTSVLHAIWTRGSNEVGRGVFYSRKVAKTGEPWSSTLLISRDSSIPYYWSGGLAAGPSGAIGMFQNYEPPYFPVYASSIAPGVSCP